MFFAGNTSKRGFSTRKCKESARMASMRTSSAAPVSRRSSLAVAAVRLMPAIVCALVASLPLPAAAKALASASLHIASFSWYNDVGILGDPSDDVVLLAGDSSGGGGAWDLHQFTGSDSVASSRYAPDFAEIAPAQVPVTSPSNSAGPLCAPGSGCAQAPTDFLPITSPDPISTFYNANAQRTGQFVRSVADPGAGSLAGGIRADVSLTENATTTATTGALWTLNQLGACRGCPQYHL
jgi:hypothetical protein